MSAAVPPSAALRIARPSSNARSWGTERRRRAGRMMLMRIERWDPRRDGPLTESALRHKIEARGYRVSTRTYPPGAVAAAQSVESERLDGVATGLLKVTIDDETAILTAGDVVYVPCGSIRRVEVVGNTPVLCLEAVYFKDDPV